MSDNLLQLLNIEKSYGSKILFRQANVAINRGEHIGVIGPNGAGKTTLFKIINQNENLDAGEVIYSNQVRLGYLPQEDNWHSEQTLEQFLTSQCETPLWELQKLGTQLGLKETFFSRPLQELSGGYKMRAKLLVLLGKNPNLLMLDEPTNYLDLETILTLERFLQNFKESFLLISHDREFLKRTTNHIIEIENGTITKYNGHIDDYFEQKESLRLQSEKQLLTQEIKRKQIIDFANKFRAKATKAKQVQSRLKQLDKLEKITLTSLPINTKISIPTPTHSPRVLIKSTLSTWGYGELKVLKNVDFEFHRKDHIAVVGLNGAGKSTFLKGLSGQLLPLSGQNEIHPEVSIGYFAQHNSESLKPNHSVLQSLAEQSHPCVTTQDLKDLAGALMFSGDDIHKKISVLSGGERSRVALGQILAKRVQCLLLDEPTNHLDFHTVEALTEALKKYTGSFILVSHDRSFIARVATKIIEINHGTLRFFPGTYDEYVWSLEKGTFDLASKEESISNKETQSIEKQSLSNKDNFNFKTQKKALEKQQRINQKKLSTYETQLEQLQEQLEKLNNELPLSSGNDAQKIALQLSNCQNEIDQIETHWLRLMDEQHEIETQLKNDF